MSKKKKLPKAPRLEALKDAQRARDDGWYEVVDQAIDSKRVRIPEFAEDRIFFKGKVGDVHLIEVPSSMPEEKRNALGMALSAQGLSVLLLDENIKYMRLRRAKPHEERMLNAAAAEGRTNPTIDPRAEEPSADPSDGSVADGIGHHGAGEGREDPAVNDAQPAGGDAEGGADRLDPR